VQCGETRFISFANWEYEKFTLLLHCCLYVINYDFLSLGTLCSVFTEGVLLGKCNKLLKLGARRDALTDCFAIPHLCVLGLCLGKKPDMVRTNPFYSFCL
jgi:hypothetical protein